MTGSDVAIKVHVVNIFMDKVVSVLCYFYTERQKLESITQLNTCTFFKYPHWLLFSCNELVFRGL